MTVSAAVTVAVAAAVSVAVAVLTTVSAGVAVSVAVGVFIGELHSLTEAGVPSAGLSSTNAPLPSSNEKLETEYPSRLIDSRGSFELIV